MNGEFGSERRRPSADGAHEGADRAFYESYVETHTREAHRRLARNYYAVRQFMPRDRNMRVLDLGCGSGVFLKSLQDAGYTNLEGVDVSAQQVELAVQRGVRGVRTGDARDLLRISRSTYDVITANDFIEHLTRAEVVEVFREVMKALKPGGLFLGQTPNGASPFFGRYLYGDFTHYSAFTEASIQQICALSGFATVSVVPVLPNSRNAKGLARRALWNLSTLPIKIAVAAESGRIRGHIVTSNLAFRAVKGHESL